MATSVLIGAWVAAGLTLFMFSFLYKDNPFFRFGEHLYVGVSMGYTIVRIHYDVMMKSLYGPVVQEGKWWLLVPALLGLLVHAGLDGAALYTPPLAQGHPADLLPLAVVLHRLPESLAIWWLLSPSRGPRLALAALGAVGLATVAGYLGAGALLPYAQTQGMAWFQALVGGALLHVVVHRTHPGPRRCAVDMANFRVQPQTRKYCPRGRGMIPRRRPRPDGNRAT